MATNPSISRRRFLPLVNRPSAFRSALVEAATASVIVISDTCLAGAGIFCMSCRDSCPEQAIVFQPHIGSVFLPEVKEKFCTGCGACVPTCPTRAIALVEREAAAARG